VCGQLTEELPERLADQACLEPLINPMGLVEATDWREVVCLSEGQIVPAEVSLHGLLRRLLAVKCQVAEQRRIRRQEQSGSPQIMRSLGEPRPHLRDSCRLRRHAAAFPLE
jgi:hypothetical protein